MQEPLKLTIRGMHCDACVRRVTQALTRIPGVAVNGVQVGSASLAYDGTRTSPAEIAKLLDDIGFQAERASE